MIRFFSATSFVAALWHLLSATAAVAAPGDLIDTIYNPYPTQYATFGATAETFGNSILIGALGARTGSLYEGAVYQFVGSGVSQGQLLHEYHRPNTQSTDRFGQALATVDNLVIVADPRYINSTGVNYAGAVHIYDSLTGNHVQTINNPSPFQADLFGWDIAAFDTTIVISELSEQGNDPNVYLYDAYSGSLLNTISKPVGSDDFGRSLAVSDQQIFVGAPRNEPNGSLVNSGSVFAFDRTNGSFLYEIPNPTPLNDENFGDSIQVVGDKLVVGGWLNEIYVYDADTGGMLNTIVNPGASSTSFGAAMAAYGDYLLVGSRYGPQAHIIDLDTGSTLLTFDVPGAEDFPASVGTTLALAEFKGDIVVGNAAWKTGIGYPNDEGRAFLLEGLPPPTPDLVYDPVTGNVKIYADGANIGSFNLQSAGAFLPPADFSALTSDTGVPSGPTDNTSSDIGWVSGGSLFGIGFDGPEGAINTPYADLGNIFPTGLDLAGLTALLSNRAWAQPVGGGPGGDFDLFVQPIPEPGSFVLLGLGLMLCGRRIVRRRGRSEFRRGE